MNISQVIETMVTDLKAKTWTSPSGTGTTQFKDGFNHRVLSEDAGYPYFFIEDLPGLASNVENVTTDFEHTIGITIAVNYKNIEVTTTNKSEQEIQRDQKSEGKKRIREAFDFLRNYMIKNSTINVWFSNQQNFTFSYEFNDEDEEDLNLLMRTVRLKVLEVISKL